MRTTFTKFSLAAALFAGLAGCENDPTVFTPGELLAVTNAAANAQSLIGFDRLTPGTLRINVPIMVGAGETVIGLDIRPSDGVLVALTRAGTVGRLYRVNAQTGVGTLICTLVTGAGAANVALGAATNYGVDFNPTALGGNALRVVDDAMQNLRVETRPGMALMANVAGAGQCATATDANLDVAGISAAAYTNSVSGATTTTLFYVDTTNDNLRLSAAPNTGVTSLVGALGVNIDAINGFNIVGTSGAVATIAAPLAGAATSTIFSVNLNNGAATAIGTLPVGTIVTGLTSSSVQ